MYFNTAYSLIVVLIQWITKSHQERAAYTSLNWLFNEPLFCTHY